MSIASLAALDVWRPILDAIALARAGLPPSDTAMVVGSLNHASVGTHGTNSPGISDAWIDTWALSALSELLSPDDEVAFQASITPDGTAEVLLIDLTVPELAMTSPVGVLDGVVLAPGVLPEPYRRAPVRTHRAPSPGADPDVVRRIVRDALPSAEPSGTAEIAELLSPTEPRLPAEVVALFESASSGELLLRPGGSPFSGNDGIEDDEPHGMAIFPPDSPYQDDFSATHRAYAWSHCAAEVVAPDPLQRVQPLGHSSAWMLVGTDWGGGYYVVDLAPGPRGTYGQILHVPRERSAGARWVAPSLTEFLLDGEAADADPYYANAVPPTSVRIGDHTDQTLADVTADTEVLHVNRVSAPVDLTSLAGHPRLRSLVCTTDRVAGLSTVLPRLPALEYLELPFSVWAAMVSDGAVPRSLAAAGFDAAPGDLVSSIALANTLLIDLGRAPVPVVRVCGDGTVDRFAPT